MEGHPHPQLIAKLGLSVLENQEMAQSLAPELETADRIWHFMQAGLMDGLSASELRDVAALFSDRFYWKGDIIFNPADPADHLFVLNRGCVRVSLVGSEDREKIVGIYTTGDIFGEAIFAPEKRFATRATAHEDCWVSAISRSQLLSLMGRRFSVALNLIRILSERLRDAHEEIETYSFHTLESRLGKKLLAVAKPLGKKIVGDPSARKLKIFLSHNHLARVVGGNRPHTSTIMSRFKRRGWVSYQARKLVINVKELERAFASHDTGSQKVNNRKA